jgi:RNA polymerase sigma-70 factor (ECF subfamily)
LSDAEDLVQDALERALRFEHRFDGQGNLKGWLHHILLMVYLTRRKRKGREARVLEQFMLAPDARFSSPGGVESHALLEAVERLPEPFLSTVLMVYVQGFRCAEAAPRLGVALGTVLSRLHRARAMLRAECSDPEAVKGFPAAFADAE